MIDQVRRSLFCDDVGDKSLFPRDVLAGDYRGLADRRVSGYRCLDLAQLDAKPADFDLMVYAAKILQISVCQPARPIPRAVEPGIASSSEWVGYEALLGKLRAIEISPCDPCTSDVHFAGHANWHRLTVGIEDINLQIRNRNTYNATLPRAHVLQTDRPIRYVHGGLGDAVHVDQQWLFIAVALEPWLQALQLERLAAEDHVSQGEV